MAGLFRTSEIMPKRSPACFYAGLLFAGLLLGSISAAESLETRGMRAPESPLVTAAQPSPPGKNPSVLGSALLGSIRFFQHWISPVDGPRCRFSPTCSRFGYEAVHEHGPLLGVVMTADRLMRCSPWTEPGQDYLRLPNGALHDPLPTPRSGQL